MSRVAAGRIGPQPRIASRSAHDRGPLVGHVTERPHHARNVSMSRSTCLASARSFSSAARSSASARIDRAASRRAASIRAVRTTVDTGVPSLVKTASALDVSASGRKVIMSATGPSVIPHVRQRVHRRRRRVGHRQKQLQRGDACPARRLGRHRERPARRHHAEGQAMPSSRVFSQSLSSSRAVPAAASARVASRSAWKIASRSAFAASSVSTHQFQSVAQRLRYPVPVPAPPGGYGSVPEP